MLLFSWKLYFFPEKHYFFPENCYFFPEKIDYQEVKLKYNPVYDGQESPGNVIPYGFLHFDSVIRKHVLSGQSPTGRFDGSNTAEILIEMLYRQISHTGSVLPEGGVSGTV